MSFSVLAVGAAPEPHLKEVSLKIHRQGRKRGRLLRGAQERVVEPPVPGALFEPAVDEVAVPVYAYRYYYRDLLVLEPFRVYPVLVDPALDDVVVLAVLCLKVFAGHAAPSSEAYAG